MAAERLPLSSIRRDGGTQTRASVDVATVNRYADSLKDGAKFPPIVVYFDGTAYWLADGFHRVAAHDSANVHDIDCDVRQGTRDDAVWHSVGANKEHDTAGRGRSRADVQRAIETALRLRGASESDRAIAAHVGCSHVTVGAMRAKLVAGGQVDQVTERVGRDGKTYSLPTPKAAEPAQTSLVPEPAKASAPKARQEPNPFTADTDGEAEPVVAEPAPVVRVDQPNRGFGQVDVSDRLARVASAVRRFESDIRAAFDGIDPRFAAEVRERSQDFLLNAAETVRAFLPPDSSTPKRPSLSVVR